MANPQFKLTAASGWFFKLVGFLELFFATIKLISRSSNLIASRYIISYFGQHFISVGVSFHNVPYRRRAI